MPMPVDPIKCTCQECGVTKLFKPHKARVKKFCSRACARAHQRVEHSVSPGQRHHTTYGQRSCVQCHMTYEAKGNHQKFCSQHCQLINIHHRRIDVSTQARPCEHCQTVFRPRPASAGRFCSRRC